ncbi:glucose 1-dehydrogenase [Neobacillus drentensis]|uniref:glucose 1-dehydrogenase n=1 Tax=Neobacillus drentensis TaxID=220684 RepID=UPI003001DAC6
MARLENKVSLITGAASGIGKAIAQLFAKEGSKIVVADMNEAGGQETVDEIKAKGGQALFIKLDVTKEEEWTQAMNTVRTAFGKLDVLINNAGMGFLGNIEELTYEEWRHCLNINLDSVFLGTKYGVEIMKENKSGSIINMSSIQGLVGDPNAPAYNASKAGQNLLTKSVALHCAKSGYGIRVNSIHPGYINTPMILNAREEYGDELYNYLVSLHPIGHLGESIDIAFGVLYLASDESKFTTGTSLVIDGGFTAQ